MGIDGRRACVAGVDGLDRAEVFDLEVWEKDSAGRGEGTLKFVCIFVEDEKLQREQRGFEVVGSVMIVPAGI